MATWASFETDGTMMKQLESTTFEDDDATDVKENQKTTAKIEMLDDLEGAWDLDETDADFEENLDAWTVRLTQALAFLQLHLYFHDNDAGEESQTRYKANYYIQKYNGLKETFAGMYETPTGRKAQRKVLSR